MDIFELARSAGVTPSVVRFYTRSGTLAAPHPQPDGRLGYDARDAARLRFAVTLHRLGEDPAERLASLDALLAPSETSRARRGPDHATAAAPGSLVPSPVASSPDGRRE